MCIISNFKILNPKQIQIIKSKIKNCFEFKYLDFDIVYLVPSTRYEVGFSALYF